MQAGRGKQSDLPIVKSSEDQGKVVCHRHEDLEGFQNSKKKKKTNPPQNQTNKPVGPVGIERGILGDWSSNNKE